ncbi:tryptophan halogenase family protein [Sphingomicrobium sediminis]|uniref:Tryptophan 7-halogenase n=1 Tax=Sphingomicrobium sediminis TaxID=2950949 RepID=A0A9X2EIZ4_9SPHN|nr:tryptophan halogenase family protein [Sphingomicrobium sediminis]MCM8556214.1 tryptophan 7-halogenase [Sphingomicrobium sediminis]
MHPGSITILGGGTAGWMAACLVQKQWPACKVRLIESSKIGIIGVGEGSTPQMKAFFDAIGVTEAEWMPRAHATYKVGIRFEDWSGKPGFDHYFHPFPSELDVHTAGEFFHQTQLRRGGLAVDAHPDRFLLPGLLADQKKGPQASANFPFEVSYGYHFDAHEVGSFLKDIATERGVEWIDNEIADVEVSEDGDVAALVAKDGERYEADFFFDASGFRAMIIEQALGAKHLGFGDNLFNDSAVVMPTDVAEGGPECATRAIAMKAGWRWSIPLTHRTGNGYVFSSRYIDPQDAEAELRGALGLGDDVEARHLKMRCGRLEESWKGNCLAVGLSQGFLEPLEATALHIVLATVEGFIAAVDRGGLDPATREQFNSDLGARYEGIRDYIVAHYRTAPRRDTQYWQETAEHDRLSDSLKQVMTAWFTGQDLAQEVARQGIATYYNAASWHCLLAGYGNFPDVARLKEPPVEVPAADMGALTNFLSACAMNYRPHSEMLAALNEGQ